MRTHRPRRGLGRAACFGGERRILEWPPYNPNRLVGPMPILRFGMLPEPLRIALNLTIVAAKRRCATHGERAG
jgi:hypothetical protein